MSTRNDPVIIVRRKAKGHGGHHGSAWKVAYADFVTAMMAFFMVLWLVNQSADVKESVAGYFKDPGVFAAGHSTSMLQGGQGVLDGIGTTPARPDMGAVAAALEAAAARIRENLADIPGFRDLADQIVVQITAEGLRIELQEGSRDTFFDAGSAHVKPQTEVVLSVIAKDLSGLELPVIVEGHTDSRPYGNTGAYSNWELSTDRANAARRVMQTAGLSPGQIRTVRGFADTQLRTPDDPYNPRNRRVSIVVPHALFAEGTTTSPAVTGES
jgi:chemotaxis protein MotB